MAFQLTPKAQIVADGIAKQPNLVLKIDGIDDIFGSALILKLIRVGEAGLFVDGTWLVGGSRPVNDQLTAVSFDNSTTSIRQQLEIDKGRGSSITSLEIGLIDFNEAISQLVSPGVVVEDVLGRKASVFLGIDAEKVNYPDDYIRIFRGIIDDIQAGAGLIRINIAHPEQKKKAAIYQQIQTQLVGPINNTQTTIDVVSTLGMLKPVTGPDSTIDPAFKAYVRIGNEFIEYTGISGNQLTGCVRAQLGQPAANHAAEAEVTTLYRFQGRAMLLALKMMMSQGGPFVDEVPTLSFVELPGGQFVGNAIVFNNFDLAEEFGLVLGDFISVTGAANPANNFTLRKILSIEQTETGQSYLIVDGPPLVVELESPALVSFRSQFDTLPEGLRLGSDEVDVDEHLRLDRLFLSNFAYDIYQKETIENGREWLEQEIYNPAGSYTLNRKAKASAGLFVGPIPTSATKVISDTNVTNPDKLRIRRTINRNFANTIVYRYEESALEERFLRGVIYQSATSLARIPIGVRSLVINSKGLRDSLLAQSITALAADRRLKRFRFGAEMVSGINVTFGSGFNIEIGDILVLDGENLQLVNTEDGTREKPSKLFEVVNISKNFKNGQITMDLLDTSFDGAARYGLIGPSSEIVLGSSETNFQIKAAYSKAQFGDNEFRKWTRYPNAAVRVRSPDFTARNNQSTIQQIVGNTITVATPLGFTPQPGDVMELAEYGLPQTQDTIKLIYGFMTDQPAFSDGKSPYQML
jgi:hypothetical protein